MSKSLLCKHTHFYPEILFKQNMAMNLATDAFRFVNFDQTASTQQAEREAIDISDLYNRLTDADCAEFVSGLQDSLHNDEMLYYHVIGFTEKMLNKRHLNIVQPANDRACGSTAENNDK